MCVCVHLDNGVLCTVWLLGIVSPYQRIWCSTINQSPVYFMVTPLTVAYRGRVDIGTSCGCTSLCRASGLTLVKECLLVGVMATVVSMATLPVRVTDFQVARWSSVCLILSRSMPSSVYLVSAKNGIGEWLFEEPIT